MEKGKVSLRKRETGGRVEGKGSENREAKDGRHSWEYTIPGHNRCAVSLLERSYRGGIPHGTSCTKPLLPTAVAFVMFYCGENGSRWLH